MLNKFILIVTCFLIISLSGQDIYAQSKASRKEAKRQENELRASRLFIDGQRFLMLEDFDRAYFYFQKALEISPDEAAINFKIAEILLRANRVEKALEYGMRAVEIDPENKYYNLVMAEVYTKQGEPLKAAEILENLMANSEENQNYILDLASLYLMSGEMDKALDALNRAEDYYGVAEQLTVQKQRIYLRKNNLQGAIDEGRNLIDSSPGNSQYVINLVEILFNNGRTAEAIQLVEEVLDRYPEMPDLQMAAYALFKDEGNFDRSEKMILEAFSNSELDPTIVSQSFGEILQEIKTERREKLLDKLEELMLAHHVPDADVYAALGDRYFFNKDNAKAMEFYRKSVAINPSNPQLLQGIITGLFELGKDFKEIEHYTNMAVDEFPERPEFWFFDGTVKSALKKGEEAEISLLKSKETNAGKNKQLDLLIQAQLGDTYHLLGKKEEAFEAYEAVLKEKPDDEHVMNNYAYYLSLEKKDLNKARSMSEKLVKRFPKNATYLDTHAWVLFQLEEYEEAKKYMEMALENEENPSGVMWEHYGDILYHLGKKNEALTFWKKAEGSDDTTEWLNKKIKERKYYD